MKHESKGNEVTPSGIVHRCSCGWVSRACFSNAIASGLGMDHREYERERVLLDDDYHGAYSMPPKGSRTE